MGWVWEADKSPILQSLFIALLSCTRRLTNFIIYGLKWYMTALNWRIIKYFLFVKYFWSNKAIIHYGTTRKMASFICCHKRSVYGVLFCWFWARPSAPGARLYINFSFIITVIERVLHFNELKLLSWMSSDGHERAVKRFTNVKGRWNHYSS